MQYRKKNLIKIKSNNDYKGPIHHLLCHTFATVLYTSPQCCKLIFCKWSQVAGVYNFITLKNAIPFVYVLLFVSYILVMLYF